MGPPESPLQDPYPPSSYPAHSTVLRKRLGRPCSSWKLLARSLRRPRWVSLQYLKRKRFSDKKVTFLKGHTLRKIFLLEPSAAGRRSRGYFGAAFPNLCTQYSCHRHLRAATFHHAPVSCTENPWYRSTSSFEEEGRQMGLTKLV